MQVVLASKSPRRQELLKQIYDDFIIDVCQKEETYPKSVSPTQIPVYIATSKAKDVAKRHPNDLIIASDTVVILKNKILGKPKTKEEVYNMMSMLSNKTHMVVTGVCIVKNNKRYSFNCKTFVTFNRLSEEELNEYCKLNTVYDKAGAYAIQGEAAKFIKKIEGDYYNVVGLPLSKLYSKLKEI